MSRKARFRAALALGRKTERGWAEENGISRFHLYAVLKGERRASAELDAKIDAFIARHLDGAAS